MFLWSRFFHNALVSGNWAKKMPFGERFKGCFCIGFYMYSSLQKLCVELSITWWHRREECSGVFSPSSLHMRVPASVLMAADNKGSFVLKPLLSKRVPTDKYRKDLKDGKLNFPRLERRSVLFWAIWFRDYLSWEGNPELCHPQQCLDT